MKVRLISVTNPVPGLIEGRKGITAEELIIYIARVSNPSNQENLETAPKLLAYLIRNKHFSPFEMVNMCVEIVTSRAIAHQVLRHRSFSYQEFSQRYAEVTDFERIQLRKQAEKNRQSSTDKFDPDIQLNSYKAIPASVEIQNFLSHAQHLYKSLLEAGVAKECARFVLPTTTQTRMYMNGTLRSWIHYLALRLDEHTQMEHRQIAVGINDIFQGLFPETFKAIQNEY